jgi:HEAT repeat protein
MQMLRWSWRQVQQALVIATIIALAYQQDCGAEEPIYDGKTLSQLVGMLKEPRPGTRVGGACMLGEAGFRARAAIPTLVDVLRDGRESTDVKIAVISALELIDGSCRLQAEPRREEYLKRVITALQEAAKDRHERVRAHGLSVLSKMATESKDAVPYLLNGLGDSSPLVRYKSVRSLAKFADSEPDAALALIKLVDDPELSVRFVTVRSLGMFKARPNEVVPALMRALKDIDPEVRWLAGESLARFGAKATPALPQLEKMLEAEVLAAPRFSLALSISHIHIASRAPIPAKCLDALRAGINRGDLDGRIDRLYRLTQLGPTARDLVPDVAKLLNDKNELIRTEAAAVLKAIDPSARHSP